MHFCSRTAADITATSTTLPATAHGRVVDVSSPQQITAWVTSVAAQHSGRIDVVVANVSALAVANTQANWEATFATDMRGTMALVEAAVPFLTKGSASVVYVSSVTGRYVDFTAPGPYGAAKAGMVHYMSQLGHVLVREPRGVRVNSVSPGNIYEGGEGFWARAEREMPELFGEQMRANPMGRMGRPEEVADAVVWLASERASFVSGANLLVDGAVSPAVQF